MDRPAKLYDRDFVLWTEEQARALRAAAHSGANLPLDWENLAEEVESLGRSDRRELENRIEVILVHLLKLKFSRATQPRRGWTATVREQRSAVRKLLRDSPSLQGQVPDAVHAGIPEAFAIAVDQLAEHGESHDLGVSGAAPRFTSDQVLGDWWPPERPRSPQL